MATGGREYHLQLHLHLMSCKPQPMVGPHMDGRHKAAFGPVTYFASCQESKTWDRKLRDAGSDGREEYWTADDKVNVGSILLGRKSRTQVYRMKNYHPHLPKRIPKNTSLQETRAKLASLTAKIITCLLTETKAVYFQPLKLCIKALCPQLQLFPN